VADPDNEPRKPLSPLRRLRFLAEYALLAGLSRYFRLFPRWYATSIGSIAGTIAYPFLAADRKVAHANLDIVLGDARSRRQKRRIVRRTFRRVGRVVLGLFWAPRLTPARCRLLFDGDEIFGLLRELEGRRKGVVLVTAHYGDWELACLALGAGGFPIMMVTEPVANPRVEALFVRLRTATGNRTVPPKFALLKLFRGLRRGERVAVACDVNGRRGRGGVWVDFFGRQVFNGAALAELALRTESAVLFAAMGQAADGRATLRCRPPIEFAPTGDRAADVRRLTQQVVDFHADLLREDPEPWLWTYKRWKRRPTPDVAGYPFYSKYARVD
jgi:KDO2-lipid IV(A) lauroyltransferase